ncbi:alpha/beta fold hydrolase [Zavarzinia compransoris]|nr:alpha/beta fold hydrolase [Zavarzinia compransoris]
MRRVTMLLLLVFVGAPLAALLAAGVASSLLGAAVRIPVAAPPADLALAPVRFTTRDGVEIAAWSAEAEAPKATVIIAPGFGSSRGDAAGGLYALMRDLLGRDYSVLALDLRNHGESGDGPRLLAGGIDEAADIVAALDWIKRRHPSRRIAVYGIDLGAAAALVAVAGDPRIEAVVSADLFARAEPFLSGVLVRRAAWPALAADLGLWGLRHLRGERREPTDMAVLAAHLPPMPWLIVQSAADPLVPLAEGQALAKAAPWAAFWVAPAPALDHPLLAGGGLHGRAHEFHREDWIEIVASFLDSTFATMFG